MKNILVKYTSLLLLSLMIIISCQPKESHEVTTNEIIELNNSKTNKSPENQNIDIRRKFVLYDLDLTIDAQELNYFAIKTYCKSWNLPLIQLGNYKEETFAIAQHNDTLAIFKQSWIPADWENGIILLKPKTSPDFIHFSVDSQINQISTADEFFGFYKTKSDRRKQAISPEAYESQYKEMRFDVDNYYNFQATLDVMDNRFVDYSKTTNMTNQAIIESYLSLKYHIKNENHVLIAHCLMQYPFEFINHGRKETIKTPEETINQLDTIFSKQILHVLNKANYLRLNTEGNTIFIGDGELWFRQSNNRVKITKISVK